MAETQEITGNPHDKLTVNQAVDALLDQGSDEGSPEQEDREVEASELSETAPEVESDEEYAEQPDEGSEYEAKGEEGAEVEEPEDEDGDETAAQEVVYEIPLADGTVEEVTETELRESRLRWHDYTQKTQELNEERKTLAEDKRQTGEARERYLASVAEMEQQLVANFAPTPELFNSDPQEYMRRKTVLEQFAEERKKLVAERQKDLQERHQTFVAQERTKLLDVIPEWRNEDKRRDEQGKMMEFARRHGYSDQEIQQVVDHRNMRILRMAYLYEKGLKTKEKAARKKAAKVTPQPKGQARKPKPRVVRKVNQAQQNLKSARRGKAKIDAAVDLLEARHEQAAARTNRRR